MLSFYASLAWISGVLIASFALAIFLGSEKPSSRAYAFVAFAVAAWCTGMGGYYFSQTYWWILFWGQYNHFVAGLIAPLFYLFAAEFPEDAAPPRRIVWVIFVSQLLFLAFYTTSTLIIHDYFQVGTGLEGRSLHFGPLGYLFHLSFLGFFLAGFVLLWRKMRKITDPQLTAQMRFLFLGALIGVIPTGTMNLLLPTLGDFRFYWIGPMATLVWVALSSYAIVRHHALSLRLVLAEVAVLAMGIILFLNVFVPQVQTLGGFAGVFIFLSFSVVGGFFIASITKSERQKEALADLTGKLSDLNARLHAQVQERTVDLAKAKARTETVIENLVVGLVEVDGDGIVTRLNRAAEEMLGLRRDEAIGTPLPSALSPVWEKKNASADIHLSFPLERDVQVAIAPVGNLGTTMFTLLDITQEKQIADSKSDFITIVARKMKAPLLTIRAALDKVARGKLGAVNARAAETVEKVRVTDRKLTDLLDDLLNVSQIDEGRFLFAFARANAGRLAQEVADDYEVLAREKKIGFRVEIGKTAPFRFDAAKLSLALHALLDNAFHYTKEGGEVRFEVRQEERVVVFTIADSGIGIPKKDQERLFTKFFRAENATKVWTEGSGLGLFIVKNVVDGHHGTISLASPRGKGRRTGTQVDIRLPMVDPTAPKE